MHGITGPDDLAALALDGTEERRQVLANLVRSHAHDHRETAGILFRVEHVNQAYESIRFPWSVRP